MNASNQAASQVINLKDKKPVFRVTTTNVHLSVEKSLEKKVPHGANLDIRTSIQRTKALRYEAILDYLKTTNFTL